MRGQSNPGIKRQRHGRLMLRPALLVLMQTGSAHGYEMLERLKVFGFNNIDPSLIYRALRNMEEEGLVVSTWDKKETQGPPRRVYSLTSEGSQALKIYIDDLKTSRDRIEQLIKAYEQSTL